MGRRISKDCLYFHVLGDYTFCLIYHASKQHYAGERACARLRSTSPPQIHSFYASKFCWHQRASGLTADAGARWHGIRCATQDSVKLQGVQVPTNSIACRTLRAKVYGSMLRSWYCLYHYSFIRRMIRYCWQRCCCCCRQ